MQLSINIVCSPSRCKDFETAPEVGRPSHLYVGSERLIAKRESFIKSKDGVMPYPANLESMVQPLNIGTKAGKEVLFRVDGLIEICNPFLDCCSHLRNTVC